MSSFLLLISLLSLFIIFIWLLITVFKRKKDYKKLLILLSAFFTIFGLVLFNSSSVFTLTSSIISIILGILLFLKFAIMKTPEKVNGIPDSIKTIIADNKNMKITATSLATMMLILLIVQGISGYKSDPVTVAKSNENEVSETNKSDAFIPSVDVQHDNFISPNEITSSETVTEEAVASLDRINDSIKTEITSFIEKENEDVENIIFDASGIIISIKPNDSFSETQSFKKFAQLGVLILKYLSNKDIQDIILVKEDTFIDAKGNENDSISFSSYYTLENIKDINFVNWENQVFIDPYLYYELADGYSVHLSIFSSVKDKYLKNLNPGRANENNLYIKYGY